MSCIAGHHRGRFPFLHASYHAAFPTPDHRDFLVQDLQLAEIPRLVNPGDTAAKFSLSADFRFLMDNLATAEMLELLRHNWDYYSCWVVSPNTLPMAANEVLGQDSGNSHECIRDAIASMPVQLLDGRLARLGQTCLPREDVLAAFGLVKPSVGAAGVANTRSTITMGGSLGERAFAALSVPELDSPTWDMLELFDVVVRVGPKDFVRRLQQLRQGNPTQEEVAIVYERIEMSARKGKMIKALQALFRRENLVFLPSHSPAWVALNDCLWEAPKALKKTPQLKEHYPERWWLFCRALNMATTASLTAAIEEAKRISKSDSLRYIRALLRHVSKLAGKTDSPRNELQALRECAILPVWAGMPRDGFDYLSPPLGWGRTNECYIADKPYLRECFQGRAPLLAFDSPDVEKIDILLVSLDCGDRKLSKLVRKVEPGAKGKARSDDEYTKYMQERA
ncbi:hypothetical protein RB594_004112, partial [Gaeumannomyces avenae]